MTGSHDRPKSALNLRLALAIYGLVVCTALAALTWWAGFHVLSVVLAILAVIAAVDLVVVARRIRSRRRRGEHHTLFE
ncbi:hypothetical protein DPM19_32855 [Actinomadura craniellae]|uniref:Uncharacterized protein n=1 Tax=Actinomadura craniellae TaxID=2231787 RepID=A0A365GVT8_9ACTN|nr:DUF6343 family protein [Actinomadura craniellae]RAY10929.1 hypothetical protein DPM19_32855 [Actinomadura craniellae]